MYNKRRCAVVLGKTPGNWRRSVGVTDYEGFMMGAIERRPNDKQWDAFLVTFAEAGKGSVIIRNFTLKSAMNFSIFRLTCAESIKNTRSVE